MEKLNMQKDVEKTFKENPNKVIPYHELHSHLEIDESIKIPNSGYFKVHSLAVLVARLRKEGMKIKSVSRKGYELINN